MYVCPVLYLIRLHRNSTHDFFARTILPFHPSIFAHNRVPLSGFQVPDRLDTVPKSHPIKADLLY